MNGWTLTLRCQPDVRVDLRTLTPQALAGLSLAEAERLQVGHGNRLQPLADFFQLAPRADETLVIEGDCARFDKLGWQLAAGRIEVHGDVGHHLGCAMTDGEIHVHGSAGTLAGCEMAGGRLEVQGDVGDFAASTLPGSMDGMRGGAFVVRGHAGARLADRMRRGTLIVFGDAGDFAASRMVAGTLVLAGAVGAHLAYGMRRGSILRLGPNAAQTAEALGPTFVPAHAEAPVFWQLLARDLERHGGPLAGLARRRTRRWLGDLAADGKGEVIVAEAA